MRAFMYVLMSAHMCSVCSCIYFHVCSHMDSDMSPCAPCVFSHYVLMCLAHICSVYSRMLL